MSNTYVQAMTRVRMNACVIRQGRSSSFCMATRPTHQAASSSKRAVASGRGFEVLGILCGHVFELLVISAARDGEGAGLAVHAIDLVEVAGFAVAEEAAGAEIDHGFASISESLAVGPVTTYLISRRQ